MEVLPKLCTGIDVNVRFHDPKSFEPTPEVSVFDLLDIELLHGGGGHRARQGRKGSVHASLPSGRAMS